MVQPAFRILTTYRPEFNIPFISSSRPSSPPLPGSSSSSVHEDSQPVSTAPIPTPSSQAQSRQQHNNSIGGPISPTTVVDYSRSMSGGSNSSQSISRSMSTVFSDSHPRNTSNSTVTGYHSFAPRQRSSLGQTDRNISVDSSATISPRTASHASNLDEPGSSSNRQLSASSSPLSGPVNEQLQNDGRRSTYASFNSQTSQGSRSSGRASQSKEASPNTAPLLQLSNILDPSEFSLAGNSSTSPDQLPRPRVSYPNPEQVLDTKSMYFEQNLHRNSRAESVSPSQRSPSVASSVASTAESTKNSKKPRRSLFGKLTQRRDSSADLAGSGGSFSKFRKPKRNNETLRAISGAFSSSTSLSSLGGIRHKGSVHSLSQGSQDGHGNDGNPPPVNYNQRQSSVSNRSRGHHSSASRSESYDPLSNVDHSSRHSASGSSSGHKNFQFTLDTDLKEMNGIVKGRTMSQATSDDSQVSPKEAGKAVSGTSWIPPESWGVASKSPTDTRGSSSRINDSNSEVAEKPVWGAGFDYNAAEKKMDNYCLRVFREDGTFGTLSCPLDITVYQLLRMLGRKFFMDSIAGYQLAVRTGRLVRIMNPEDKPLIFQKMLLEFMGYTERERLNDVGRDDLSYLCRFEFSRTPLRTLTAEEENEVNRNFKHVDLHNMSLQAIPIMLFQHASEIVSLDLSENPSINVPLDFIQACTSLKTVRYTTNWIRDLPPNFFHVSSLESLDLSNNLILEIKSGNLAELINLKSLNIQGNRLRELPESISELKNLEYFNLSSNNITNIEPICSLTNLKVLDLAFNRVENIPLDIKNLSLLEKFAIPNNKLSKELPDTFEYLQNLKELDIRFNNLQNIAVLAKLRNLENLYCSKNFVHSFDHVFSKLRLFYFDRNPITKISFGEPHYNLTVLNLSKAKLTQLSETWLDKLPNLETLVLDKNHLMALPANIGNLKHLMTLSVVSNALGSLPPEIGQLSSLRTLDLHSNNLKSLPPDIWNLSSLTVLNVSSNLLASFPKHAVYTHGSVAEGGSFFRNSTPPASVAGSGTNSGSRVGTPRGSTVGMDIEYQFKTLAERRPSTVSVSSNALSPKDAISRRGSLFPPSEPSSITPEKEDGQMAHKDSTVSSRAMLRSGLAGSLLVLLVADNQLSDTCFEEITLLSELQVLNLSYNDLLDIPTGALGRLTRLKELYISGNRLASLPSDDFEAVQSLRVFMANANKLHSLPAELGKITNLQVLDVGSNALRYNINNWPYDWNWNWNLHLRYLNFSGNRRLEIKSAHNQGVVRGDGEHRNLSDFTVLEDLRILGLMDVTLTVPTIPDQTENCRVRTYGSSILSMPYGMADTLGDNDNLSIMDMVIERFRGHEKEAVIGLFEGRKGDVEGGNKFSKLLQESFGSVLTEELAKLREGETNGDALRRAFLSVNKLIGNATVFPPEDGAAGQHRSSAAAGLSIKDSSSGSCATIVYINDNKMYVANVGDSSGVLSKGNGEYTAVTIRHDPTSQEELERIRGGAGVVSRNGLLDDVLDVSRAIGFYNLVPHINAAPSVSEYDLTEADDFLIIASRELWEYVSYEVAVDVARTEIDEDPMAAAQKLRDFAIAYGCNDKIMVMVIAVGGFRRKPQNKTRGATSIFGGYGVNGSWPVPQFLGNEDDMFTSLSRRKRDRSLLPEDSSLARLGAGAPAPVGEVAMVFTDIKNSTLLWETYPLAMRSAIKVHNNVMRRNILITGAYEVKNEGDAFIVSFSTPTSALLFCFSVQSQLLTADWPAEVVESSEGYPITDDNGELIFRGLSVRMGIHWGSPVAELDPVTHRMDYFGPMVNRTARISAVADGGQITVSQDFLAEIERYQQAHQKYIEDDSVSLFDAYGDENLGAQIDQSIKMLNNIGYKLEELGELKLKGLENPELITVIYPRHLATRLKFHDENRAEEMKKLTQQREQAHLEAQKQSNHHVTSSTAVVAGIKCADEVVGSGRGTRLVRAPHQMGGDAKRIGNLTLDLLTQLRWISHRLDKICSSMSSGMSQLGGSTSGLAHEYNRRTSSNLSAVIPNTDYDYVTFFDHLVTRIENAVGSMYLRLTAGALCEKYGEGEAFLKDLSEIMKALETFAFQRQVVEETVKEEENPEN